jgi:DNA-binding NarL/FixJ family response regulator
VIAQNGSSEATTVLIVDDDHGFARAATEMLTARGYVVVGHATTAASAVSECTRLSPDAVLLDIRLPDGNGLIVAETLTGAAKPPAVLLTSTEPLPITPERLSRSAAAGFVAKAELARTDLRPFLRPTG